MGSLFSWVSFSDICIPLSSKKFAVSRGPLVRTQLKRAWNKILQSNYRPSVGRTLPFYIQMHNILKSAGPTATKTISQPITVQFNAADDSNNG